MHSCRVVGQTTRQLSYSKTSCQRLAEPPIVLTARRPPVPLPHLSITASSMRSFVSLLVGAAVLAIATSCCCNSKNPAASSYKAPSPADCAEHKGTYFGTLHPPCENACAMRNSDRATDSRFQEQAVTQLGMAQVRMRERMHRGVAACTGNGGGAGNDVESRRLKGLHCTGVEAMRRRLGGQDDLVVWWCAACLFPVSPILSLPPISFLSPYLGGWLRLVPVT